MRINPNLIIDVHCFIVFAHWTVMLCSYINYTRGEHFMCDNLLNLWTAI